MARTSTTRGTKPTCSSSGREATVADNKENGLTLVEVSLVLVLLVGLVSMISQLTLTVGRSQGKAQAVIRTMHAARDITDGMRPHLSSAVFLAQNNTRGNAYLTLMDHAKGPARVASRLPKVDAGGIPRKDTGSELRTGNVALFAEHAGYSSYVTASNRLYSIPLYRFHVYYLSEQANGPRAGSADGLDLNHWVSETVADGARVDEISDGNHLKEVLLHLRNAATDADGRAKPRVEVVWHVGGDPAVTSTLRLIEAAGTLADNSSGPRGPTWKIVEDSRRTGYRLLEQRQLSIATNFAPSRMKVAEFGITDTTGFGFPHGLEVQIVGPSSARKILVRLVVVESGGKKTSGFTRRQIVAHTPQGATS